LCTAGRTEAAVAKASLEMLAIRGDAYLMLNDTAAARAS
jgi:hypothetical protein